MQKATEIDLQMNRDEARKINLAEKKPNLDSNLSWNDQLEYLRKSLSNWRGALWSIVPKSMAEDRINHLLFVGNNVPKFEPKAITTGKVYEITPGEPKKVLSHKFFIEPNIPFNQQKNLVILVHGARTTGKFFEKLVNDLVLQGHPVLVGDMLGFGVNGSQPLTNHNLINDLIGMIEEAKLLRPNEHISIVGHSLGAAVAITALREIFERENHSGHQSTFIDQLVLVSAWDTLDNVLKEMISEKSLTEELQGIIDTELGTTREELEKLIAENLTDMNRSVDDYLGMELNNYINLTQLLELSNKDRIKSFKFIHGDQDPFVSSKRSQELHKLATQYGFKTTYSLEKNGGHFDKKDSLPNTTILNSIEQNGIERNVISKRVEDIIDDALNNNNLAKKLKSGEINLRQAMAVKAKKEAAWHEQFLTAI